MSEISVLAQDTTKTDEDRSNYNSEFNQLNTFVYDTGAKTYNEANLARLRMTSESFNNLNENLSAANSRIKDVDVASESTQFARYSILAQSGTAMPAQANLIPQSALRLLG